MHGKEKKTTKQVSATHNNKSRTQRKRERERERTRVEREQRERNREVRVDKKSSSRHDTMAATTTTTCVDFVFSNFDRFTIAASSTFREVYVGTSTCSTHFPERCRSPVSWWLELALSGKLCRTCTNSYVDSPEHAAEHA